MNSFSSSFTDEICKIRVFICSSSKLSGVFILFEKLILIMPDRDTLSILANGLSFFSVTNFSFSYFLIYKVVMWYCERLLTSWKSSVVTTLESFLSAISFKFCMSTKFSRSTIVKVKLVRKMSFLVLKSSFKTMMAWYSPMSSCVVEFSAMENTWV